MNVFCALFPFRLNRINISSRFSLFICLTSFFVCFNNNQYVTLALPEGYSRVAFNLFPRKNSEFYPPAVSYRYGYNLAHPTSRNAKETGTDNILTAGSELRPTVILPRNLIAPSQSASTGLGDTRPVIFESTKDVNRFVPGVPLLFKIRPSTPREDFVVTPWFQTNPNILLAGSVIPSNFNFKYTPTPPPNTQPQTSTESVQEIIPDSSESTPSDEYLPVTPEPTTTTTSTTTEKPPVEESQEFELPFPLPRPTLLKQIDKDDDESFNSSEHPLNYSDHYLKSLAPPFLHENAHTNADNTNIETEQGYPKIHKPPTFFLNVVPENHSNISLSNTNIVSDSSLSNDQISTIHVDNETTEISSISQIPYTESEDSTTNSDVSSGNKLTRQVKDEKGIDDVDDYLDLPPIHYEPDSVTENNKKTTNVQSPVTTNEDIDSDINSKESSDLPPSPTYGNSGFGSTLSTPNLNERTTLPPSENSRSTNNESPNSDYIENQNNPVENPRSGSFFMGSGIGNFPPVSNNQDLDYKVTTPNTVFVTPILPEDPDQEQIPPSTTRASVDANPFNPQAFDNLPKNDNNRRVSKPKQSPTFSLYEQVQVPTSSKENVPLDPLQRLVAALTASVQRISSRASESPSQQYFSFHIGTININFDNKGAAVPNQYTILSNVPANPTYDPPKAENEHRNVNHNPQTQYPNPNIQQLRDPVNPVPEKRTETTEIPFTVPLPKFIQPSEYDDPNDHQMQSHHATNMFPPSQNNEKLQPPGESVNNVDSSQEKSFLPLPVVPKEERKTQFESILPTPLVPEENTSDYSKPKLPEEISQDFQKKEATLPRPLVPMEEINESDFNSSSVSSLSSRGYSQVDLEELDFRSANNKKH